MGLASRLTLRRIAGAPPAASSDATLRTDVDRRGAAQRGGARAWSPGRRGRVPRASPDGLVLAFVLPAERWVDLDTIVESTLAGLRDAGAVPARYAGLDAIVATKDGGSVPGARVTAAPAAGLARRRPPGPRRCSRRPTASPGPGAVTPSARGATSSRARGAGGRH